MTPDRNSFWFGSDSVDRRITYAKEYQARKDQLEANAISVMKKYDAVATAYCSATGRNGPARYASGWRPGKINDATANSAKGSAHLDALAGDGADDVDGSFAWWCFANQWVLEAHQVYMEHPVATVVRSWQKAVDSEIATGKPATPHPWCHLSPVPPRSGLRIYLPDNSAPNEWDAFTQWGGYAGMRFEEFRALKLAEHAGKKRTS